MMDELILKEEDTIPKKNYEVDPSTVLLFFAARTGKE